MMLGEVLIFYSLFQYCPYEEDRDSSYVSGIQFVKCLLDNSESIKGYSLHKKESPQNKITEEYD